MPEDPAYAEIRALRERLAHLEEIARAQPPTRDLGTALHDHYKQQMHSPEARRKALESRAYGFHPDPGMEQEIATRAKDPKFYDAEMRRVGADAGTRIFYEDRREAAIKLGRFDPNATTEEET